MNRSTFLRALVLFAILSAAHTAVFSQSVPERPNIIRRNEWQAKDPVGKAEKHKIRRITIHHTATPQRHATEIAVKMRNLQAFSQREDKLASGKTKPAWFDVPYHFYIAVDGQIAEGRELKYVGDTNTEYDPAGHALIVLEGSFDTEQPTPAQISSLKRLVFWLADKYNVPAEDIKGHGDYADTACPGENLKRSLPELRTMPRR